MRKLLYILPILLIYIFSSCMDEDMFLNDTKNTTTFSVFECDENYTEKSITTSYISIGAEISIWKLVLENETPSYILEDVVTTGIDGKAIYKHDKESFYYSVEKITGENKKMSNLISPLSTSTVLANSFEVAGIFSSEKEIEKYYKYSLPHLSEGYVPRVGSVKFKDINGDETIDIEDSVSKVFFYNPNREEIVYIALLPTK